jgi:dolichol-phosphate mannosyltransferase
VEESRVSDPTAQVGVVIPTYNEAGNIASLLKAVLAAAPGIHAIVVDDNSPDGTGRIADSVAKGEPRVTVIHRMTERGRGTAGRDGFVHCLNAGYDLIMEMDADFSHDPADIPKLIDAAKEADVVLGSRQVAGGGEAGRSLGRRFVTWGAGWYMRLALGVPHVRDVTSGFRCFRREALLAADVATIRSKGPSIVTELLFRCRKMRIMEVPIFFRDRAAGTSKFNLKAMWDSLLLPPKLWWRQARRRQ